MLTLITPDTEDGALQQRRQHLWQSLSDPARCAFAGPDPGAPRSPQHQFDPPAPAPEQPLADFCGLLLAPDCVDYLNLRGDPQERWLYQRSGQQWTVQAINP